MSRIKADQWAAFCAERSEVAFTPIYEATKGLVFTLCYRILRNEDDARDAHVAQWLMPGNLHPYGSLPRTFSGLVHIPFAPFIHGSLFHIIANSLPLVGLGFLIQLKQRALFWELTAITIVLAGLGTWLVGSGAALASRRRT